MEYCLGWFVDEKEEGIKEPYLYKDRQGQSPIEGSVKDGSQDPTIRDDNCCWFGSRRHQDLRP
eukprot:4603548-Prorocentrum_lima.AAC.1